MMGRRCTGGTGIQPAYDQKAGKHHNEDGKSDHLTDVQMILTSEVRFARKNPQRQKRCGTG